MFQLMKATGLLSFIMTCSLFLFFSCTKNITIPDLEGSLVGFVYTYNEYGNILESHENVLVTALGTEKFTTKTDKNGRFEFMGLPAGTYEIAMEKEGFGTMRQLGIKHLGGEPTLLGHDYYDFIMVAFSLIQTPSSSVSSLSIENDTLTATLDFHGKDPSNVNYSLMVYFSSAENFDPKDAEYVTQPFPINTQTTYRGIIDGLESEFGSGTKVWYKACIRISGSGPHPVPVGSIDSYFDYSLNEMIYPALGPVSNENSYVVP